MSLYLLLLFRARSSGPTSASPSLLYACGRECSSVRGLNLSRQALKGHLTTGSDGVGLLSQCGAGSVSVWGGVDLSAGGRGFPQAWDCIWDHELALLTRRFNKERRELWVSSLVGSCG